MRIGVDLDGVVYNFVDILRSHFIARGISTTTGMPEPDRWEIWSCWGMEEIDFVKEVLQAETDGVFHKGQAYAGAIEALQQLRADGHTIHIITHRIRPRAQTSTIGWLNSNEIVYESLTFAEGKGGYPVDVCIEDNIDNAQAIEAAGTPCVVMTRRWNESLYWYRRVSSWSEFVEYCNDDEQIAQHRATMVGEVRKVSATGGEKGSKPEQYSLIPVAALAEVARVYGFGAEKYDRENWRRGYEWSLSYDAALRHINAFWAGQDFDTQSGLHHLAHATFHLFTLMTYGGNVERYDSYDNRVRTANVERPLH